MLSSFGRARHGKRSRVRLAYQAWAVYWLPILARRRAIAGKACEDIDTLGCWVYPRNWDLHTIELNSVQLRSCESACARPKDHEVITYLYRLSSLSIYTNTKLLDIDRKSMEDLPLTMGWWYVEVRSGDMPSGKTVNAIGRYISHNVTICCLYRT